MFGFNYNVSLIHWYLIKLSFYLPGYTEGSTEIQGYTSVGVNMFGFNYNVTLIHWYLIKLSFYLPGYTEGSTEIQGYTSVGVNMFGFNYNVTLIHSSMIYVTVIAVNMAGLSSRSHSTHFIVDLTPPNVVFVNDGTGRFNHKVILY
jgi:hypothetical protein